MGAVDAQAGPAGGYVEKNGVKTSFKRRLPFFDQSRVNAKKRTLMTSVPDPLNDSYDSI